MSGSVPQALTTMASSTPRFKYDAIILNAEEDNPKARDFCEFVKANIALEIITFDDFSMPGKAIIQNLEDAIGDARFIFCCEHYYTTNQFGTFAGQVAMLENIPDRLVKLSTRPVDQKCVMKGILGIKLQNWEITNESEKDVLRKLRKLFSVETKESDVGQNESLPELPDDQYHSQDLSSDPNLEVANPSIKSCRSAHSAVDKGQPPTSYHSGQVRRRLSKNTSNSDCWGAQDLPGDDLQEDTDNNVSDANFNGNAAPSVQSTANRPVVSSSSAEWNGHNPNDQTIVNFCIIAFIIAISICAIYTWKQQ